MISRKRLTGVAIVVAVVGFSAAGAWATPNAFAVAAGMEQNAKDIAAGLLTTSESNISCGAQPDARVLTQSSSVGTVSQQATVLISGEGVCANLQVPTSNNYLASARLHDKYYIYNTKTKTGKYIDDDCNVSGPTKSSLEGAWVQTPLTKICTFPEFVWNGTGYQVNPALNTVHEVVWTVTFPNHERLPYEIPSGSYFLAG